MKTKLKLSLLLIFTISFLQIHSQVSTPTNTGTFGDYVGWNALQAFPLTIAHYGNQPINILTNNIQRGQWTTGAALETILVEK